MKKATFARVYRQHESEGHKDDEDEHVKYDEVILTDKRENMKHKFDLLGDIYAHTARRVLQNQQAIVEL